MKLKILAAAYLPMVDVDAELKESKERWLRGLESAEVEEDGGGGRLTADRYPDNERLDLGCKK